uniref:Ficolin-like protein 2 n=1 Tax=Pacifastacus leniusculus TaxID=6720 RepID=E2EKJ1_PACLE|nr:ficolin-like protein 2 [Pacifastacus leniusculus]
MALMRLFVAATLLLASPSPSSGTQAHSECEEHPVTKDVVQQLLAYTGATLSLVQDITSSFTQQARHPPLADGSVRRDLLAELLLALFNKLEAEQTRHTREIERLSHLVRPAGGSRQLVHEYLQSAQPLQVQSPQSLQDQSAQPLQVQSAQPLQVQSPQPLQVQSAQPLQVQSAEPLQVQSAEPLQVQSAEPLQVQSAEQREVNCNSAADRPVDCHDLLQAGHNQSGVYQVYPYRCGRPEEGVRVWCDLEGEDSGWTVILARRKLAEQVNFNRGWRDYREGFGDPETEFWIGNRVLHELTSRRPQVLRVELGDWDGESRWAEYQTFLVEHEDSLYRLHLSQYTGDAGDALKAHDNMFFTTSDRDNDSHGTANCASNNHGGFWYHACHTASPTSLYLEKEKSTRGLNWNTWHTDRITLKTVTFIIKPKPCSM